MLLLVVFVCATITTGFPYDPGDDITNSYPGCYWSEHNTEISLVAKFYCVGPSTNEEVDNSLADTDGTGSNAVELQKIWEIETKREYLDQDIFDSPVSAHEKRKRRSAAVELGALAYDQVLRSYMDWRTRHGYGNRHTGRWGRDVNHVKSIEVPSDRDAPISQRLDVPEAGIRDVQYNMLVQNTDGTQINKRTKRSVGQEDDDGMRNVLENKLNRYTDMNGMSRSKREAGRRLSYKRARQLLSEYRQWRQANGYGNPLPGRWG